LLALVLLRGGRPDHRHRELMQPVPRLNQVFPQLKRTEKAEASLIQTEQKIHQIADDVRSDLRRP
jgi:hypothetical protein